LPHNQVDPLVINYQDLHPSVHPAASSQTTRSA